MGLDRDFLELLTAPVTLERVAGVDLWGNEVYEGPVVQQSFISGGTTSLGADAGNDRTEETPDTTDTLIMDAIGIKPGDKITYGGKPHWVTQVETAKDEFGADLYQNVTVTTTKRG